MRHIHRRSVLAGALALAAAPVVSRAQQPAKVYRIAVWSSSRSLGDLDEASGVALWRAFFSELRRLGFVPGVNLTVDRYANNGVASAYEPTARDIVASRPDVIFASPAIPPAVILRGLTTSIPIVVPSVSDPVAFGLAQSLARPGANVTGFTQDGGLALHGLRLQLLKEAVPGATRIGYLTTRAAWIDEVRDVMRQGAATLGVELSPVTMEAFDPASFRAVFTEIVERRIEALVVGVAGEFVTNRKLIVEFAASARLPAIYGFREFADDGGLMGYGVNLVANFRKAAGYAARILNGEKPQDLPFQQPTTFDFVVNTKTAKDLGITLPETIFFRATEVIE